jgi:hypothetical protein
MTQFKGEDKTYTILVVDEDGERVDITGFSIEFEVKVTAGAADPADIAKSVGSGIVIDPDQVNNKGEATLSIDPSDTNTLAARVYKYDIVVIDLAGERHLVTPPSDFDLREVVNIAP